MKRMKPTIREIREICCFYITNKSSFHPVHLMTKTNVKV